MSKFIRHISVLALAAALILGAGGVADAQDTYAPVMPDPDAAALINQQLALPGPLSNTSGTLSGEPGATSGQTSTAQLFQVSPSLTPATADGSASAGGTGGAGNLAFTGASSATLAAGGMALVLAGGAAVIASRKRS